MAMLVSGQFATKECSEEVIDQMGSLLFFKYAVGARYFLPECKMGDISTWYMYGRARLRPFALRRPGNTDRSEKKTIRKTVVLDTALPQIVSSEMTVASAYTAAPAA